METKYNILVKINLWKSINSIKQIIKLTRICLILIKNLMHNAGLKLANLPPLRHQLSTNQNAP